MITFFETFRIETISKRLKCNENDLKGKNILAIHGGQNENKSLL